MKVLNGTTIEINNNSIRFVPEDVTYPWWRERLSREKEGVLCPQIIQHMWKISLNLSEDDGTGRRIGKYNCFMTNLPPKPKSSQGSSKTKYKKHLLSYLKRNEDDLKKFKDKEIFVYIALFLREKKFNKYDVDNFAKAIIDSLKDYTGDDNKVTSVYIEKFKLENYPVKDLDFLEQAVILIADPKARQDILKEK